MTSNASSAPPSVVAAGNELPEPPAPSPIPTPAYPPFRPYVPPLPSVRDSILTGKALRALHKSRPRAPLQQPPVPSAPSGPKAGLMKMTKCQMRAHLKCMHRHGAILCDRLEQIAKPKQRSVLYMWREHADTLPPETIARLRNMLDVNEPFNPEQAYKYFMMQHRRDKTGKVRPKQKDKDIEALLSDSRFAWARNAIVTLAKGIQQRLSKPCNYDFDDSMVRLSDIILAEICGYMKMQTPSRSSKNRRAKFMVGIADKIAAWIDEVLTEADDRMLMMDFDEDLEIQAAGDAGFTDDFLDMMGGGGLLKGPQPAYLKFTGEMMQVFKILTNEMFKKGDQILLSYKKYEVTYKEGATELKQATDFKVTQFNTDLFHQVKCNLASIVQQRTPKNLDNPMKEMIDICSKYLAQIAEFNKDKGPAFKHLVKTMKISPDQLLYQQDQVKKTLGKAARDLEKAKSLDSSYGDPELSNDIRSTLAQLVEDTTPEDMESYMEDALDISSKYLSQKAMAEEERGEAFDILIKELVTHGAKPFTPQFPMLKTNFSAAHALNIAQGLTVKNPDPKTAPVFKSVLKEIADGVTPPEVEDEMDEVVERCGSYLSAFLRDREKAMQLLLKMMKANAEKNLAKRKDYDMDYGTGATITETSPTLTPFVPVKDIADEIYMKLSSDMESTTPPDLDKPMKSLVQDVANYLSQPVAGRSGVAGERYPLEFLSSVMTSLGEKPLYKHKTYGQSYSEAGEMLKFAGPLESNPRSENLGHKIKAEMNRGVASRLAPAVASDLHDFQHKASMHLAKVGTAKGAALDHLISSMKQQGSAPLGVLQGYEQTHHDGARRLELATSLKNENVDKNTYEAVKRKLTHALEKNPAPELARIMPEIVEDASKYLAEPLPSTPADKRRVLANLMARKGETILDQAGMYKITYEQGGEIIKNAPVGVVTTHDETKKEKMMQKIHEAVPEPKLKELLNEPIEEGAAYLTDTIAGRGEAIDILHKQMSKKEHEEFLDVGHIKKSHKDVANMLEEAPHFGSDHPAPFILEKVNNRMKTLDTSGASVLAKKHMDDATGITSKYVAAKATKESGLDAKALAALEDDDDSSPSRREVSSKEYDDIKEGRKINNRGSKELTEEEIGCGKDHEWSWCKLKSVLFKDKKRRDSITEGSDTERDKAEDILHKKLRCRGKVVLHKQSHTKLTYAQAAEWLKIKPPIKVDKIAKESAETGKLHLKFEGKLNDLVSRVTPPNMEDTMQDVIVESSRKLSEYFAAKAHQAQVQHALISKMQNRGNEILAEVSGASESYFFAAQRLKKVKELDASNKKCLCNQVGTHIAKKLDDLMRSKPVPRKITYLLKDAEIEAYMALLEEMEATGDSLLIETDVPMSYSDCAAYLRQLTTFEDIIDKPNPELLASTTKKLREIMKKTTPSGYTQADLNGVVKNTAQLLVSYAMLQGDKNKILRAIIGQMNEIEDHVLLRHGPIRKTYKNGVELLDDTNINQLGVSGGDPVVTRKLEQKLESLLQQCGFEKSDVLAQDVAQKVTAYLAVKLLEPRTVAVCKCQKNVFVQCELWSEEIFRRVNNPNCTCNRHISAQALSDLSQGQPLTIDASTSQAFADGIEIQIKTCPQMNKPRDEDQDATESDLLGACCSKSTRASYLFHSTSYRSGDISVKQSKGILDQYSNSVQMSTSCSALSQLSNAAVVKSPPPDLECETDFRSDNSALNSADNSRTSKYGKDENPFWRSETTMFAEVCRQNRMQIPRRKHQEFNTENTRRTSDQESIFTCRTTIVSTNQMSDWHAMMVSLMWNVQAWRTWIQNTIQQALACNYQDESMRNWVTFQRKVTNEALQWRQYNIFSRQLALRLAQRYRDKEIVSPTRATVKTQLYMQYQEEMFEIINIFDKWTSCLYVLVQESNMVQQFMGSEIPLNILRWNHFRRKVEELHDEWEKYNKRLKIYWEHRYKMLLADWMPSIQEAGPVWVMSACGAVPSGAVVAGEVDGEPSYVARTTHRTHVLPGALLPSKHCCLVHADGAVNCYTKYQVMCNVEVSWVAWRAGAVATGAVKVAPGVHVGRVQYQGSFIIGAVFAPKYRCHVVIFGRAFAFSCYELLILS